MRYILCEMPKHVHFQEYNIRLFTSDKYKESAFSIFKTMFVEKVVAERHTLLKKNLIFILDQLIPKFSINRIELTSRKLLICLFLSCIASGKSENRR